MHLGRITDMFKKDMVQDVHGIIPDKTIESLGVNHMMGAEGLWKVYSTSAHTDSACTLENMTKGPTRCKSPVSVEVYE
jgi:hypothetical protein